MDASMRTSLAQKMTQAKIMRLASRAADRMARSREVSAGSVAAAPMRMPASSSDEGVTLSEIVAASAHRAPVICGIYFLLMEGRVIYVGRSIDCHDRVCQHRRGPMPFDSFYLLEAPDDQCVGLERFYIDRLNPMCNNDHITRALRRGP